MNAALKSTAMIVRNAFLLLLTSADIPVFGQQAASAADTFTPLRFFVESWRGDLTRPARERHLGANLRIRSQQ